MKRPNWSQRFSGRNVSSVYLVLEIRLEGYSRLASPASRAQSPPAPTPTQPPASARNGNWPPTVVAGCRRRAGDDRRRPLASEKRQRKLGTTNHPSRTGANHTRLVRVHILHSRAPPPCSIGRPATP